MEITQISKSRIFQLIKIERVTGPESTTTEARGKGVGAEQTHVLVKTGSGNSPSYLFKRVPRGATLGPLLGNFLSKYPSPPPN